MPWDATRHDAGKPTPSDVMPIIATPPKDAIFSTDEPQDAFENEVGKPTPFVATP
jgi:hypothetical protein